VTTRGALLFFPRKPGRKLISVWPFASTASAVRAFNRFIEPREMSGDVGGGTETHCEPSGHGYWHPP
jgi:hypothetical protein